MPEFKHIVLMGDSIFDNDGYVPGEPGVIEQTRRHLPKNWSAAKVAVDGDCIEDIPNQIDRLPRHATDLIISIGGNDLMKFRHLLFDVAGGSSLESVMKQPLDDFEIAYAWMLDSVLDTGLKITVCTIYTAIPFKEPELRNFAPAAIAAFNDLILRLSNERSVGVVRIDSVCDVEGDFSEMSPIEPSSQGGQKIVSAILEKLTND